MGRRNDANLCRLAEEWLDDVYATFAQASANYGSPEQVSGMSYNQVFGHKLKTFFDPRKQGGELYANSSESGEN